jgi:hypothetical protein
MNDGMPFPSSAAASLDLNRYNPASLVLPPAIMTYEQRTYKVSGLAASGEHSVAASGQAAGPNPGAPSASPKWYESRGVVFALSLVMLLLAAVAAWRIFRNEHSKT